MKVFITGGLGFVGQKLSEALIKNGHTVTVVERNPRAKPAPLPGVTVIAADASRPGAWQEALAEHDTIINLAGVSIFSRWTRQKKQDIVNSRLFITRNVVDAIKKRKGKPTFLISTSAVGFYGFHGDEKLTETDIPGEDFLAALCREWEAEAMKAEAYGARVAITRFGIVLGTEGGALGILTRLFRFRLGNRLGQGKQWFSWIHQDDLVSVFLFLLKKKNIRGPVNCSAPNPVTNRDLTKALNRVLGTFPLVPPAPGFLLSIVLGEFGDFLLKGQRALPFRLLDSGFVFKFPHIDQALTDILSRQ
jgi:uncharacterized protein (TIGR01777 family)